MFHPKNKHRLFKSLLYRNALYIHRFCKKQFCKRQRSQQAAPKLQYRTLGQIFFFIVSTSISNLAISESLRVGTTLWPGYEPLYLAQEIQAYKKDIRMVHYPSTSEVLRAFKNRTVEVAALTLDEIVQLEESGINAHIILVLDISEGADVIMAKPEIKNMQGLIGAKVAVESSAVGAYTLTRALELHSIDISRIHLFNVENSNHEDAYNSHFADAVVTYEPVRTQLLNAGAIEIFNSTEIPGEIVDVLVAHKNITSSHKDELYDVVRGWFSALDYMKNEPAKSYKFIASRMKVSTQEAKESYRSITLPDLIKNRELLIGKPAPLIKTFDRLTEHMKNSGLIQQQSRPSANINPQFLP